MARNVTDAAVLLGALTGIDPDDPATSGQVVPTGSDYTPFLDDSALEGARIGVWSEGTVFAEDPDDPRIAATEAVVADAIDALEAEGAIIVDGADLDIGPAGADELFALECEFKTDIAAYLETYTTAGFPKSLAALIEFNEANQDIEGGEDNPDLPWNNQIWEDAEATGGRGDPECDAARAALTPAAQAAINDVMAELDLDAIVAPTNGPAWPTDPSTATTSRCSSARRARPPWRDTRASRCPRATSTTCCPSACRSSAGSGTSRTSSGSPTTSSRRRSFAFHHSSCRPSATEASEPPTPPTTGRRPERRPVFRARPVGYEPKIEVPIGLRGPYRVSIGLNRCRHAEG